MGYFFVKVYSCSPAKLSLAIWLADILLNETEHTEIYLGNGLNLGAHWDWDGVDGDSSGKEICSGLYWDSNWDGVLRYVGEWDTYYEI